MDRREFLRASAVAPFALAACGRRSSDPVAAAGLPAPTGMLRTSWSIDPFARGSYSYLGVGATRQDRVRLGRGVAGRLFFAGEATHPKFPSTVHGAYLSGERAASQVIAATGAGDEVVVVGAGMAGLAAAARLRTAGRRVLVIEARDRLGGRVHTVRSGGLPFEMGAAWIHGLRGNPLTERVRRLGLETVTTDYRRYVLYDAAARRVSDAEVRSTEQLLQRVLRRAATYGARLDEDSALRQGIDSAMSAIDPSPRERELLEVLLHTEVEHEYAAGADELSLWNWNDDAAYLGGDAVIPAGYDRIVADLADGLDIRTRTVVQRVDWTRRPVRVITDQGTFGGRCVIVTLPIGVLKAAAVEFTPLLPEGHRNAIEVLGMGLLDKVFLRYRERFWDRDAVLIDIAGPGPFSEWLNLDAVLGVPVLCGFSAAGPARAQASASDGEIEQLARAALAHAFGRPALAS